MMVSMAFDFVGRKLQRNCWFYFEWLMAGIAMSLMSEEDARHCKEQFYEDVAVFRCVYESWSKDDFWKKVLKRSCMRKPTTWRLAKCMERCDWDHRDARLGGSWWKMELAS